MIYNIEYFTQLLTVITIIVGRKILADYYMILRQEQGLLNYLQFLKKLTVIRSIALIFELIPSKHAKRAYYGYKAYKCPKFLNLKYLHVE